jgi:hypothetical protein
MVRVLEMVARFREDDADTPIILMGYLNPIEAYGHARFCADAARGRGWADRRRHAARGSRSAGRPGGRPGWISFAWWRRPPMMRLPMVCGSASGFIYYVSITGVTGTRTASGDELAAALPRLRADRPAGGHRLWHPLARAGRRCRSCRRCRRGGLGVDRHAGRLAGRRRPRDTRHPAACAGATLDLAKAVRSGASRNRFPKAAGLGGVRGSASTQPYAAQHYGTAHPIT